MGKTFYAHVNTLFIVRIRISLKLLTNDKTQVTSLKYEKRNEIEQIETVNDVAFYFTVWKPLIESHF